MLSDVALRRVLGALLCIGGLVVSNAYSQETPKEDQAVKGDTPPNPFPNRVPAVELEGGVEWLNTSGPISIKDLRGKIVLLDFWTYCCINCMHVLPDLAYLEEKYPNEIVVIGVHSAKFDNEKETGNIRKAILRYEIAHPVINDAEMIVWRKFGVNAWPTLAVIDPEGFYCGSVSGEGNRALMEKVIDVLIAYHKAKGTLDQTPVHFDLERAKQPETPLRFPGKLVADAPSNRLFISDSNHNRIVVTTFDGQLLDIIGAGTIGKADGAYNTAQFDHPQGMALVGDNLYVADTENHLLRIVDLTSKQVSTFAGTGRQGHPGIGSGPLRETPISSPWDVLHLDGVLYIAMAGPHQIWSHRLGENTIQPYAGSGREDITNGPLADSALAQPSGLATDGRFIYVCDSEGSAIRKITTKPDNNLLSPTGSVTTVAGTSDLPRGRALFEFGDVDGVGEMARLQHPLGIAYHDGQLLVADTYNHKIRQINIATKNVTSWLTGADPKSQVMPSNFSEPAGLAIAGKTLFVADTNNHRICKVDLDSKALSVLEISGLTPPQPPATASVPDDQAPSAKVELQRVSATERIAFEVALSLPVGYKFNPLASVTYQASAVGEQMLIPAEDLGVRDEAEVTDTTARFSFPVKAKSGKVTLQIAVNYTFCRDGASGLCKLGTARWTVPLEVAADATAKVVKLEALPE